LQQGFSCERSAAEAQRRGNPDASIQKSLSPSPTTSAASKPLNWFPIMVANGCLLMHYSSLFIKEKTMSVALKLSDELIDLAKPHAAAMHRSIPKQIEYWARLGKVVEDNPELPLQFIQDTLLGLEEAKAGQSVDYKFGA
jgi:ParD-like antitoxin of type II bacterial toxin-antitoxin system